MEEEYEYNIIPVIVGMVVAAAGTFGITKLFNNRKAAKAARAAARAQAYEEELDNLVTPGNDRLHKLLQDPDVSYDEFLNEKRWEQMFVDIIREGYLK